MTLTFKHLTENSLQHSRAVQVFLSKHAWLHYTGNVATNFQDRNSCDYKIQSTQLHYFYYHTNKVTL